MYKYTLLVFNMSASGSNNMSGMILTPMYSCIYTFLLCCLCTHVSTHFYCVAPKVQ